MTWWKTYLCFLLIKVGILYGYCIFSPISSSNDLKVEFWSKSFLICANNSDFKEFLFLKSLLCICRLQCACGQCGVVRANEPRITEQRLVEYEFLIIAERVDFTFYIPTYVCTNFEKTTLFSNFLIHDKYLFSII